MVDEAPPIETPTDDAPTVAFIFEADRRWADFRGGREVLLPDGQTWTFALPAAVMRRGRPGWTFGPDVPPDIDAILSHRFGRILSKWQRATTDNERASTILEAAYFLFARNYALTPAEFEGILAGMEGFPEPWQADLMAQFVMLVGVAISRAAGLAETKGAT